METFTVTACNSQPESLSDLWKRMRRQLGMNAELEEPIGEDKKASDGLGTSDESDPEDSSAQSDQC